MTPKDLERANAIAKKIDDLKAQLKDADLDIDRMEHSGVDEFKIAWANCANIYLEASYVIKAMNEYRDSVAIELQSSELELKQFKND